MAFCTINQMKSKKGVDPQKIVKDPNSIVKAFHEAYTIACVNALQKLQHLLLWFKADWA